MTPEELYWGCTRGDEDALRLTLEKVKSYLCYRGLRLADAEDVAQETLIYFIRREFKNVLEPKAFLKLVKGKAWLLWLDIVRRPMNTVMVPTGSGSGGDDDGPGDPEPVDPGICVLEELFFRQALDIIQDALRKLKPPCPKVLNRYFLAKRDGETMAEAAEALGMTCGNFRIKASRCLKRLCAIPCVKALMDEFKESGFGSIFNN